MTEDRKKISIVIAKKNENFQNTLDNILSQQKISFSDIEIIIEDGSGIPVEDGALAEYRKKVSLCYESLPDAETAALYNAGLEKANGEIVNFITTDVFYQSEDVLCRALESTVSCTAVFSVGYYDRDTDKRTGYAMQPGLEGIYDLRETPYFLPFNLFGYFFRRELIEKIRFSEAYYDECDKKFLLDFLRDNYILHYYKSSRITSLEPFENNTSKCAIQYKPWWYNESLDNYYNELSGLENIPVHLQEAVMYLVFAKINCNLQDRSKGVVPKEEYDGLAERIFRVVSLLDDKVILQSETNDKDKRIKHRFKMPRWIKIYLLRNKYKTLGISVDEFITDDKLFYVSDKDGEQTVNTYISDLTKEKVTVYAVNKKDGKLCFDCSTTVIDYLEEGSFELYAALEGRGGKGEARRIEVKRSGIYPLLKIFGKTIAERYRFIIELDLEKVSHADRLCVYAEYKGETVRHNFNFSSVYARLNNIRNSYWRIENFLLVNKKDSVVFKKSGAVRTIMHELAFDAKALRRAGRKIASMLGVKTVVLILFRWLYYLTRPIYKNRHIWITWDKLYKAGDNGEYMYQYCRKNKNANIYYMIKKDSPDYERLMAQDRKHVLVFKSFKARFIALHSEVILNTHANIVSSCGFDFMAKPFVSGLFNPEVICIQHGLTIQRIAQFQNRLFDNIKLYCCASPLEVENILGEMYGYSPESVKLTGLARYDGLRSNDKRIILITPTWRRNVVNSSVAHIKKAHNDNFKNSEYFRIYNSLINNRELIDCANSTGYKIIYLLHPAMSGQLEDFDRNEFVDIIPATGDINYEKILTESSLMVTDYSGVQFDFAYQRKPLVYYHPDTLPPHYDAGLLDYETMAFGPVCKNEQQIVSQLCDYMRNNCVIKEKYKINADNFFAFDDFGNCERIYNEIISYLKEIKRI